MVKSKRTIEEYWTVEKPYFLWIYEDESIAEVNELFSTASEEKPGILLQVSDECDKKRDKPSKYDSIKGELWYSRRSIESENGLLNSTSWF